MSQKRNHFVVLLVLVLLQCLVPLLHCHAGGVHVATGVHLHVDAGASAKPVGISELHADFFDSPVVEVANEFRRDPLAIGQGAIAAPSAAFSFGWAGAFLVPLIFLSFVHGVARLGLPPSQAPPALP